MAMSATYARARKTDSHLHRLPPLTAHPVLPLSANLRYLDVRSESEFVRGAMPGATNLPILDNDERHQVGLCYRTHGHEAAKRLGASLVQGELRARRVMAWREYAQANPQAMICCARGGLRSEYAQRWLHRVGVDLGRVSGGYKALRSDCLRVIESVPATLRPILIGGRTGSGKTELLNAHEWSIDLEALANHRGSAFGGNETPQPSQATMENHLAQKLAACAAGQRVLLEDESRAIGSRSLPLPLYEAMSRAPVVVVELARAMRATRLYEEYVAGALKTTMPDILHRRFSAALRRIRKRLGGINLDRIETQLAYAFAVGSRDAHCEWIGLLLETYYDPMYDHGLKRKAARICFRGSPAAVHEWLLRVAPS